MQEDPSQQGQIETQERYVEELAGPDDYWLTLTDAARATRRQDVSIRRWISKGLLPVRRQYVGLNQRTRLVRASDLSILTPIIDPAGAISSERSRLDLTSIPVQQAQIKEAQQSTFAQLGELGERIEREGKNLQQALTEQHTTQREALEHLHKEIDRALGQQQEALTRQRGEIDGALGQLQTSFEDEIAALGTQTTAQFMELEQQLEEQSTRTEAARAVLQRTIEQQQQYLDTLTSHLQQEVQTNERLAEDVLQLNAQLTEQGIAHEHTAHTLGQLAQENATLGAQLLEQRTKNEHEVREREKLAQQVGQLTHQLAEQKSSQETAQQELLGVLSQQQEQIASLRHYLSEQVQRYEMLSQLYITMEQYGVRVEQRLAELYHALEQSQKRSHSFTFEDREGA